MQVLVNYILCSDVLHSTTTVAQRNPIVPRKGEYVRIEGHTYAVYTVLHKFDICGDVQIIDVELIPG